MVPLFAAAQRSGAMLQVGHVVRYDPVMVAIRQLGMTPRFVEVDLMPDSPDGLPRVAGLEVVVRFDR